MSNIHVRGVTIEQMDSLIEMTKFFYKDEGTHIYQDPDFPDNVVITSTRGDNYNTIGWFQVCFDLILPKVAPKEEYENRGRGWDIEDVYNAFIQDIMIKKSHPVDLLYPPFLAIKLEKDA